MSGGNSKFDIKEDEEQGKKYEEIISLLLAAGYFRARIKDTILSPFDKVVGGMTWCIQNCNFDVDVDLLFSENSSIGQKIALTEKIVSVLPKMKCPSRIEPHQIQGSDFIHIFPVIQWLVKKALETREERAAFIKSFALSQYKKQHGSNKDEFGPNEKFISVMDNLKESYLPKRKYRPKKKLLTKDLETRVELTLLEYGYQGIGGLSINSSTNNEDGNEGGGGGGEEEEEDDETKEKIKSLLKGLTTNDESEKTKLSGKAIGGLISLQSKDLAAAAEQYKHLKEQMENENLNKTPGGIQQNIRLLENQKNAMDSKLLMMEDEERKLKEEVANLKGTLEKDERRYRELQKEEKELAIDEEQEELLLQLMSLKTENDDLKKREAEFKAQCKVEMANMESANQKIKNEIELEKKSRENSDKNKQLESMKNKMKDLRLTLAKKTRTVTNLQRKIDDIPSRNEVSQYRKRYLELEENIKSKKSETDKFNILLSTSTKHYKIMNKEVDYLENLIEACPNNSKNAIQGERHEFMNKLDGYNESIIKIKESEEQTLNSEEDKKNLITDELNELLEQHRQFTLLNRDMREEVRKNEVLTAKLNKQ